MKYTVKVKPNANKEKVILKNGILEFHLKAPARENKANKRLIEIASSYFKVAKSDVRILKGFKAKNKTIEIITQ